MANFKDFDEALNADKKETLQFKVAGKTYDLPATLPARAVLAQMGMAQEEELTLTSIADWIKSIVGEENFEQDLNLTSENKYRDYFIGSKPAFFN